MEINGTQSIDAPRQKVWEALHDPLILKQCLPGCESAERVSPEEFRVTIAAAIGPLRARFNGNLRMTESKPPESCLMIFEGQGGVVGFGKGTSSVSLAETTEGTSLSYTANAQVGGKLAQVGSRLIDNVARKMADDFFIALRRQLVAGVKSASTPLSPRSGSASVAAVSATTPLPAAPQVQRPTAPAPVVHPAFAAVDAPVGSTASVALVPAWWLAVSMVLGSAASLAGVVLTR
ncbi:CoxG family protein [Variovorax ginsengisoli]|uniref:SRPBCC domain-containing protein n=1 Tax=Variovorax ginsengisoli TaxID=363844 RepID=A0ABT8SEE7_9BURK|nr:SRPBCC domain-containing protein [Variovorax ginsengisoli]MDN8617367.1 SRPBCC domain-containing protein [Variovorax ginsengisoli]MDO1536537.1 SRPBCC domain-containing protein [Variovorax ginsengisoli]